MNYNQQVQGHNCNSCLQTFPVNGVKRYHLDNNRGIGMDCVLCPACSHNQFSSKERMGFFPLLADYERMINTGFNTEIRAIKTPEFSRHEEAEIMLQQGQSEQQAKKLSNSQFGCDKCQKPIPFGEEKAYYLARYKPNSLIISDVKWSLLCSPCEKPLNKDLAMGRKVNEIVSNGEITYKTTFQGTDFSQAESVERTPTFIRFQEYNERVRNQISPLAETERRVEAERQSKMKEEQKKIGF